MNKATAYKCLFWTALAVVLLWSFNSGMEKQRQIDCRHGDYSFCGN